MSDRTAQSDESTVTWKGHGYYKKVKWPWSSKCMGEAVRIRLTDNKVSRWGDI